MTAPIQGRVFQCAAELVGGKRELSARLGVSPLKLSLWIANQEVCSLPAFLDAVDVILASDAGFAAIFVSSSRSAGTLH